MTTRSVLETKLDGIRDDLLRLSSLVDQAIERAVRALETRDVGLAQQVIDEDKVLNEMRHKVEGDYVGIVATQQPMARDLRALVASFSIAINLERMGDHAEGICKTLVQEGSDSVGDLVVDLPQMADAAREMLRLAMDAYCEGDVAKARDAARMDDDLDLMYKQMFSELIDKMVAGDLPVSRGTYQVWSAHNLERIGDRTTNICERIEFAITGDVHDLNP